MQCSNCQAPMTSGWQRAENAWICPRCHTAQDPFPSLPLILPLRRRWKLAIKWPRLSRRTWILAGSVLAAVCLVVIPVVLLRTAPKTTSMVGPPNRPEGTLDRGDDTPATTMQSPPHHPQDATAEKAEEQPAVDEEDSTTDDQPEETEPETAEEFAEENEVHSLMEQPGDEMQAADEEQAEEATESPQESSVEGHGEGAQSGGDGTDADPEIAGQPGDFTPRPVLFSNLEPVRCMAVSPNCRTLATGHRDGNISLWALQRQEVESQLIQRDGSAPLALAFSPGGELLAVMASNRLEIFGLPERRLIVSVESIAELTSLAFSSDSKHLAVAERLGGVTIRQLPTLAVAHRLPGYGGVLAIAWCDNREQFAVASADNVVRCWSPRESLPETPLVGHRDWVSSMAISAGHTLLTGSWDLTVRRWDVDRLTPLGELRGHLAPVTTVAANPAGWLAASGSADGLVKVWDTSLGSEVCTFRGHTAAISGLAFLTDRLILSASQDGSAKVFDAFLGGAVPPREFAQVPEGRGDGSTTATDNAERYARLIGQAQRCTEQKKQDDAVELLRRAAELRRGYAEPQLLLGDCYLALGRVNEAADAFRLAVKLQPDSGWNRYRLGDTLMVLGENQEALETLVDACERLPDLAKIRLLLANAYLNEKQYGQAVREFKRIIEQLPQSHEAYHGLGIAHAQLGDLNLALEELGKAIEIDRKYEPAYSAIVRLLLAARPSRVSEASNWVNLARSQNISLDDETEQQYERATNR